MVKNQNDNLLGKAAEVTMREDSVSRLKESSPRQQSNLGKEKLGLSERRLAVKRECTDICCLIFFLLAIVCWFGFGCFVIYYSNMAAVFEPSDSYDNVCGVGNFTDRPNVYYFNGVECAVDVELTIVSGCQTPRFCVKQCPKVTFDIKLKNSKAIQNVQNQKSIKADEQGNVYLNETDTGMVAWFSKTKTSEQLICDYAVKPNLSNIIELIHDNKCSGLYLRSEPFLGRCLPSMIELSGVDVLDDVQHKPMAPVDELAKTSKAVQYDHGFFANILFDVIRTWPYILGLLTLAFFLSLFTVITIRCYCKWVLWLAIIGIVLVFGGIFVLSMLQFYHFIDLFHRNGTTFIASGTESGLGIEVKLMNLSDANELLVAQAWSKKGTRILNSSAFWLVCAIVSGVVFFVLALILIGVSSRVNTSIDLLIEASKATAKVLYAFPVLPFAMKLIVYGACFLFMVMFFDAGHHRYRLPNLHTCSPMESRHNGTCIPRPFMTFAQVLLAQSINFFMLLWLGEWIYGFEYVTLAKSYSQYYWTTNKETIKCTSILSSIAVAFFFHPGSIAFGALILASIRFVYYILHYIYQRIHPTDAQQATAATAAMFAPGVSMASSLCGELYSCNLAACCLKLMELVFRFINHNVYIMIAITGESYCRAAGSVFTLLISNPLRTLVFTGVSEFFFLLTRLIISAMVGVLAFFMFDNRLVPLIAFDDLYAVWFLVLLVFILSYYVTSICFSVYQVAVETIFICTLIDYRDNDGSETKPYQMTKSMAQAFS